MNYNIFACCQSCLSIPIFAGDALVMNLAKEANQTALGLQEKQSPPRMRWKKVKAELGRDDQRNPGPSAR